MIQWNSRMQGKTLPWTDQQKKLGLPLSTACVLHCVALRSFSRKIVIYTITPKANTVNTVRMLNNPKSAGNEHLRLDLCISFFLL